MATPKKTMTAADILSASKSKTPAGYRQAARAAVEYFKERGVDVTTIPSVEALFQRLEAEVGGSAQAAGGTATATAATPVTDIPVAEDEAGVLKGPPERRPNRPQRTDSTGASAKENKAIYSFLITNGMEKKAVDKMSPAERKAARDRMVNEATASTTTVTDSTVAKDAGGDPPASTAELEDPPKEPIKVGGKRGGRRGRAEDKKAAPAPPKNVRPTPIIDDPDADAPAEPAQAATKMDKAKAVLRGNRAADWQEWYSKPSLGLPDKIPTPLGEVNTPFTARAVKETAQAAMRNSLSPFTWAGVYGGYQIGKPIARAVGGMLSGSGQQKPQQEQQPQPAIPMPPAGSGDQYWDGYLKTLQKQDGPVTSPRQQGPPWWESEPVQDGPMMIPADPARPPEDTIRKLRGST